MFYIRCLSPLASHRVRFAPQNSPMESAICSIEGGLLRKAVLFLCKNVKFPPFPRLPIEDLLKQMEHVDLSGENRLGFLGDYIDYGHNSYQVLKYIRDLQAAYGADKVIVLKGNHEAMFLEWVDEYKKTYNGDPDFDLAYNDWLRTDLEHRGNTRVTCPLYSARALRTTVDCGIF